MYVFIQNPEKYRHSFNDGSNKLIGYNDGTCPARPNGRPSFCKQEAFDKACFIKLEAHYGPVALAPYSVKNFGDKTFKVL